MSNWCKTTFNAGIVCLIGLQIGTFPAAAEEDCVDCDPSAVEVVICDLCDTSPDASLADVLAQHNNEGDQEKFLRDKFFIQGKEEWQSNSGATLGITLENLLEHAMECNLAILVKRLEVLQEGYKLKLEDAKFGTQLIGELGWATGNQYFKGRTGHSSGYYTDFYSGEDKPVGITDYFSVEELEQQAGISGGMYGSRGPHLKFGVVQPARNGNKLQIDLDIVQGKEAEIKADSRQAGEMYSYTPSIGASYTIPLGKGAGRYNTLIPYYKQSYEFEKMCSELINTEREQKVNVVNSYSRLLTTAVEYIAIKNGINDSVKLSQVLESKLKELNEDSQDEFSQHGASYQQLELFNDLSEQVSPLETDSPNKRNEKLATLLTNEKQFQDELLKQLFEKEKEGEDAADSLTILLGSKENAPQLDKQDVSFKELVSGLEKGISTFLAKLDSKSVNSAGDGTRSSLLNHVGIEAEVGEDSEAIEWTDLFSTFVPLGFQTDAEVYSALLMADLLDVAVENDNELQKLCYEFGIALLERDQQSDALRPQLDLEFSAKTTLKESSTIGGLRNDPQHNEFGIMLKWNSNEHGLEEFRAKYGEFNNKALESQLSINQRYLDLQAKLRQAKRDIRFSMLKTETEYALQAVTLVKYRTSLRNWDGDITKLDSIKEDRMKFVEAQQALFGAYIDVYRNLYLLELTAGLI